MNWTALLEAITAANGPKLTLISAQAVNGGDIHQAWRLHTQEGTFFLKTNRPGSLPMFACEARALETIYATYTIRCPKPYAWGKNQTHSFLLMEYLPLSHQGSETARGRALAFLHQQLEESGRFGWFEDNYIGHTPQPNNWSRDWIHFYSTQRLHHQLQRAAQAGASKQLLHKGELLIEQLPHFFSSYTPKPALLHGDLWGGNSAFTEDGEPVMYDPASYYGDHETDLAMTELFGGFGEAFYSAYAEIFPVDAGYSTRKTLYNLYHILNHFNLFGGGYARSAERMIDQLLSDVR